jgi:hypothetical protein
MIQHEGNKNNAYWDDYAGNIISALNLKQISRGEWHGACPACGGKDRFWISQFNSEVKVQCRQCNDWKSIIENLRDQGLYPSFEKSENTFTKKEIDWPEQIHPYLTKKRINQHNALISGDNLNSQRECPSLATSVLLAVQSQTFVIFLKDLLTLRVFSKPRQNPAFSL